MGVTPEKLQELKNAVDIVEVISEYVPLKKSGKRFKALCPFHPDKDPSFYVAPDRQNYRCFGCGASGDVISFLQAVDNLSFPEALTKLARRAGVEIDLGRGKPSGKTSAILRANEFACKYYEHILFETDEGKPGRDYLQMRRIGRELAKQFRLGYAPAGWESLKTEASKHDMKEADLAEAGLLTKSKKGTLIDFFRQRLMFPIRDVRGRVIAFGGRVLDDSLPKYINSPETPLFKKSGTLYGLDMAKAEMFAGREVVVTEGYTDVIRAHEKGISCAVATLGTAFTDSHARTLKRYVDRIYVVFDSDGAGKKAAERSIEILLAEELDVRVVQLPGGSDLFDYLADVSAEDFTRLAHDALGFLDFKYQSAAARHDLSTPLGSAAAADELCSVLSAITNPVLRGLEIKRVANLIGVTEPELRQRLLEQAGKQRPRATPADISPPGYQCSDWRGLDLIDILLSRPDLAPRVIDAFPPDCYKDPELARIASIIYQDYTEKGIISTDCVLRSEDGERLRPTLLHVLRYSEQRRDKRDLESLLNAWLLKKEDEHRDYEIMKKGKEDPTASLVNELFELKKSRQKHKA